MPFHRGDVFVRGSANGIEEYSPEGTPVQLIEGSSGSGGFCFDPTGDYLIVPGAGLFDKQGRMLESNWASVKDSRNCVVDGSGNVFVARLGLRLTKYDTEGNPLQTFDIRVSGFGLAIALGPDGCTMYYGSFSALGTSIGRFNVCTNSQESLFTLDDYVDELRVLPNWEVLTTYDSNGLLYGVSGHFVRKYVSGSQDALRYMALDSDGTSFWMCCGRPSTPFIEGPVFRFDIRSGQLLAEWNPIERGPVAVYSPDNNGRGAG
jgi:hypothetical protein